MRYLGLLLFAVAALSSLLFFQARTAHATFHCMRIHAVMAGFNGNNNIQYVELRMSLLGQGNLIGRTIRFYDAADTLKATFIFPSFLTNAANGDSILVATQEFNDTATGGSSDFTFTNANTTGSNGGDALHPVQSPGGKVAFAEGFDNCDANLTVSPGEVDSLAYGGASADWGTAATALPNPSDNRVLALNNPPPLQLTPSDNNAEYSLQPVSASTFSVAAGSLKSNGSTPRNNSRTVLQLASAVGGIAELPDVAGTPVEALNTSNGNAGLLAGVAAAAIAGAVALGGAAWYTRKRWPR